ncbi:hypothetical protein B566_EDAN011306 [Ephemera danica]|nr:hypothetical protein B566_EDAN011306 [Ephemera danica]
MMNMRLEEDNLHSLIRKNRETVDILKQELDELHDKKRAQIADFKEEQALYLECKDQRRAEISRQKTQEKLALAQARAQDREEIQCSIEPYQEERHLCATLLNFLAKLESSTPSTTPLTPVTPSSMGSTPMTPDETMCKLPGSKEQAEDCLFLGIPRRASRKAKRSNSRAGSLNKKRLVPLTPDLLAQFASLNITAPASLIEVPAIMEGLKAKQNSKDGEVKTDREVVSAPDIKLCSQTLCLDLPASASPPSTVVQCIESITALNNGLA